MTTTERGDGLFVGQRVLVRDALGKLHKATVCPVPRSWRDWSGNDAVTQRGQFLKAWVRLRPTAEPIPWPLEDIITTHAGLEEGTQPK